MKKLTDEEIEALWGNRYEIPLKDLESYINSWNKGYREGNEMVTDAVFDSMLNVLFERDPKNKLINQIGYKVEGHEERKLPYTLNSIHVADKPEALEAYLNKTNYGTYVIMGKYDGISVLSQIGAHYSRGDHSVGTDITENIRHTDINMNTAEPGVFYIGEGIITRENFDRFFSVETGAGSYKKARSASAGLLRTSKSINPVILNKFTVQYFNTSKKFPKKSLMLEYLNNTVNSVPVKYKIASQNELTPEFLAECIEFFRETFDCDGVVIEPEFLDGVDTSIDSYKCLRHKIAYKYQIEEIKETVVKDIVWNTTKTNYYVPRIIIEPTYLDGAEVSYATVYNAGWLERSKIGIGSIIKIRRSGTVIPQVIEVLKPVEYELPKSAEGVPVMFDLKRTNLIVLGNNTTNTVRILVYFLTTIGVKEFQFSRVKTLVEHGIDSIPKLMGASLTELMCKQKFSRNLAVQLKVSLEARLRDTMENVFADAVSCFPRVGRITLEEVDLSKRPDFKELVELEGISDISASTITTNYNKYRKIRECFRELGYNFVKRKVESERLTNHKVCFSEIRDEIVESVIRANNGEVKSGVSSKTTYLVVLNHEIQTNKMAKAKLLPNVTILTLEDYKDLLVTLGLDPTVDPYAKDFEALNTINFSADNEEIETIIF